jgi:hypothetical protein
MDTKELVVGHKVLMQSGPLFKEATVTDVTQDYIEAKPVVFEQNERPWMIRFRTNGKQFTFDPRRRGHINCSEYLGDLGVYEWYSGFGGWGRLDPHPLCGDGRNPWELVDKASTTGN